MPRGIISSAGKVEGEGIYFSSFGALSAEEVRYQILYWDKVIIPASGMIYQSIPDEEILIQSGVLERPKSTTPGGHYTGSSIASSLAEWESTVAKNLMRDEPDVDWTLHQFNSDIVLPNDLCSNLQSIRFELVNALPVPNGDVPISEILDFKDRRSTELSSLHNYMDEIFLEIINDPHPSTEKNAAAKRLIQSIQDINTVADEKWKKSLKFDLATDINWSALFAGIGSTTATALLAAQYLTPLQTALAASIPGLKYTADVIRVTTKVTKTFEASKNNKKLAYLSKARSEKILAQNAQNGFARGNINRDSEEATRAYHERRSNEEKHRRWIREREASVTSSVKAQSVPEKKDIFESARKKLKAARKHDGQDW